MISMREKKCSLFALVPIQGLTSTSTLSIATSIQYKLLWQAYTPTVQGMTFGSSYFMWRKNWENCHEIMGKFTVSTTSASEFRLWLPNSITVSSKISRPTSVVWYILRGISSSWARKNWSLLQHLEIHILIILHRETHKQMTARCSIAKSLF